MLIVSCTVATPTAIPAGVSQKYSVENEAGVVNAGPDEVQRHSMVSVAVKSMALLIAKLTLVPPSVEPVAGVVDKSWEQVPRGAARAPHVLSTGMQRPLEGHHPLDVN